jgi:hypothetical protein
VKTGDFLSMKNENVKRVSITGWGMAEPGQPRDELMSYLEAIQRRLAILENDLKRALAAEAEREERLGQTRSSLHAEIGTFEAEVARTEERLAAIVRETRSIVHSFKDSVRSPEFSRLKQRVDGWRGERYVSRTELKRLLKREFT